ncbi:hypothetical protein [Roseateles oligotrophus]|uniref:Uncharacterized protein n=1 Tax=Roseateles oligotrophus TaxID=1769250 RepID=A0ABT2Y966_9BURK|nr:hypothetical protein [Roseateles oligotrophus]MCV2366589.1 hypothetical protein [Roseateles oligotrophus]
MIGQHSPQFQAGYVAGLEGGYTVDAFEMSQMDDGYVLGYVVGQSEAESFRQASKMVWAWQAGELGRLYRVPLRSLEAFIDEDDDFDGSLLRALRESYEARDDELDEDDEPFG